MAVDHHYNHRLLINMTNLEVDQHSKKGPSSTCKNWLFFYNDSVQQNTKRDVDQHYKYSGWSTKENMVFIKNKKQIVGQQSN